MGVGRPILAGFLFLLQQEAAGWPAPSPCSSGTVRKGVQLVPQTNRARKGYVRLSPTDPTEGRELQGSLLRPGYASVSVSSIQSFRLGGCTPGREDGRNWGGPISCREVA